MRVRLTLWPGQKGTKKLQARYGKRLVCVRYRYDADRLRRYKTVELIEEETVWAPDMAVPVAIKVEAYETELRLRVKQAGGRWHPERLVWELPVGKVLELGLEDRIVEATESI